MSQDNPAPFKKSTKRFKVLNIVFDNGSFCIAEGIDNISGKPAIACRWYDTENSKLGYPSARGYPQWMFLPIGVIDINRPIGEVANTITYTLSHSV